MERDILLLHQLLGQGICCSRVLVEMVLRLRGEENPSLVKASSALCKGAWSDLTCGALTGGALGLGLFDEDGAAEYAVSDLGEWFKEEYGGIYGGVNCDDILEGNAVNKALRCPGIVEAVWRKMIELLEDEGLDVDTLMENIQ